MEDSYLYQKIMTEIRQEILAGKLKPGDRLPTVRQMTGRWNCTVGTVQRAYQELARQGLVVSRAGQGTRVIQGLQPAADQAIRRARLVHHAEAFLLEMITAGYVADEVNAALRQAFERWQVIEQETEAGSPSPCETLRFTGSHDPALAWLGTHFPEIVPHFSLQVGFTGSLGGMIALAEGKADLAGCHLWDAESDSYNEPFVRRLLPGRRVALLTLAHRRLGLMTASGNPLGIRSLADLVRSEVRFVNRQSGSGTRVWLDAALERLGLPGEEIVGYTDERQTHYEVAATVANGEASVGFGLETAANAYGLTFTFLVCEPYELALLAGQLERPAIRRLVTWLQGPEAHQAIASLGGYQVEQTGELRWAGGAAALPEEAALKGK